MNMRSILRKLDRGHRLTAEEFRSFLEYVEDMGRKSLPSYTLLYDQYAEMLEHDYAVSLPRHPRGIDDVVDFLLTHRELLSNVLQGHFIIKDFPDDLHPYLDYTFKDSENLQYLQQLAQWLRERRADSLTLPAPRQGEVVCLYEDGNPYKEIGLKVHFDRLSRYSFITRLQSYRYLTRNKASFDRIEVLAPDQLGGIFTNKEKSIYYFIYLSEHNLEKAENACQLLNAILENLSTGKTAGVKYD